MTASYFGYTGKVLDVNLSDATIRTVDTDIQTAKRFIGGMGYSTKILFDDVGPDIDAFSPYNVIVFATGPLTATQAPSSGRTEITTKSALTGVIGSGNTGGMWGTALKRAGFDTIIVRGQSNKPVWLFIHDGVAEIKDGSGLWGKDTWETSDSIKAQLKEHFGEDISVMAIGQAGEHQVRYACPVNDYYHSAARSGAGAIMGQKKLKAIAVYGTNQIKTADPELYVEEAKAARERLLANPATEMFRSIGSFAVAELYKRKGCLPAKNFQTGVLPGFAETHGIEAAGRFKMKRAGSCAGCPVACFNTVEIEKGKYAGTIISNATFFSAVAEWGAKCAIDNLPAVWYAKELCHRYGMDYGSAAGSISFAMELYQREIIDKNDTDGIDITWGNEDAVMDLLDMIAHRHGFGDLLAEGSKRAALRIGKNTGVFSMTIKGAEMMWTDPRAGHRGWLFGYLTNPRGGDNVKGTHFMADRYNPDWWTDKFDMFEDIKKQLYCVPPTEIGSSWEGKALMTKWFEDLTSAVNSLGVCFFPAIVMLALGPTYYSRLLSACTGFEATPQEFMTTGERIFTLLKAYNVREGLTRQDDHWPDRFYSEPLPEGPAKGAILSRKETDQLLDEYYELRGWDIRTGIPTKAKLLELGLDDVAAELDELGKLPR